MRSRFVISTLALIGAALSLHGARQYEIWEPAPAPNSGGQFNNRGSSQPKDKHWEQRSFPIGNGYIGACIFGRTNRERIQITEKTLFNWGLYDRGGLTNFAELYLDFGHEAFTDYRRSVSLNDAIAHVAYTHNGVGYKREHFTSYPDNVLVIRLTADQPGSLSFSLRPEVPYLDKGQERNRRTGTVTAESDTLILSGTQPPFSINFGANIRVLNEGGTLKSSSTNGDASLEVSSADSVTIIAAFGTNYELRPETFLEQEFSKKLDIDQRPDEALADRVDSAVSLGFEELKRRHLDDYQSLFGRVQLQISPDDSDAARLPTSELRTSGSRYIEEMMFHYGRYLLIASSRTNTLPAGLQGAWSQYESTPWTGAYWHNINLQMNYWGAMSANLAETFESYINYFRAYLPRAEAIAAEFVEQRYPEKYKGSEAEYGWSIGTSGNPYTLSFPAGGHSGPGTGGFTSKLFAEYYNFTMDEDFLRDVGYPAILGMSRFLATTLQEQPDGKLLVYPSASPEIKIREELPPHASGKKIHKGYYQTTGATFDQGFVWENYRDTLDFAEVLGIDDPFLDTIAQQIDLLDPVLIGESGQVKEYREERAYGEWGEKQHRHVSQLCVLYPGTLINSNTPKWLEAARKTLEFRGSGSTGWSIAHRMALHARLKEGDLAHERIQRLIERKTLPNLWTTHPPFQIDSNFGLLAGVAEMLIQSHEGYIDVLPATPEAWAEGSFEGLVARGNFVLDAIWQDGELQSLQVTSRAGGTCKIAFPGAANARITLDGQNVTTDFDKSTGAISFPTQAGQSFQISL